MADLMLELPDEVIFSLQRDAARVQMDIEDFVREVLVGVASLPDGVSIRSVRAGVVARRMALL